jgi:hypothetical protein
MNMKKILTFLMALLIASVAFSQNNWIGGASGSWTNAANWSVGVPGAGDWVIFDNGLVIDVTDVPWHNSQPMWAGAPGNTLFDLGYLHIVKSGNGVNTTVKLHGTGNVELRLAGVPAAAPKDKTFYIQAGCQLDLTNPDGQKVALDLAPHTSTLLEAGSQLVNGLPFEYSLGGGNITVHALRLEASCGQTAGSWNVNFKQMNTNPILNAFVQFMVCCKDEWKFFSPPTTPAVLCCTFNTDYVYQNDNTINPGNPWTQVPGAAPWPLEKGRGYEMLDPSGTPDPPAWQCTCPPLSGGTYTSYHVFNGVLNNYTGNDWTLTGGGFAGTGWELIGNPYACTIDLPPTPGWPGISPTFWTWKSEIDPSTWVWSDICDGNPSTGTYYYYNFMTGVTVGYPGGVAQGRLIPAMQGFFVFRNALPTSGLNNLHVSQGAQVLNDWTPVYKDGEPESNKLSLKLNGSGFEDEAVVYFWGNATGNYESDLDGFKLFSTGGNPQIYASTNDNVKVCADALPLGNSSVPVGIMVGADGNYSITADKINSFPANAEILLTDTKTNFTQDLRVNATYNFTAAAGDDQNRFMLFLSNLLGVNNTTENISKIYSSGSDVFVQMKEMNINGSVMIFDMTGKKVMEQSLEHNLVTRLKVNLSKGIYVVSVVSDKGTYNQKVQIN